MTSRLISTSGDIIRWNHPQPPPAPIQNVWPGTNIPYYPGYSIDVTKSKAIARNWQVENKYMWAIASPKVVALGAPFLWGDIQTGESTYNWAYLDNMFDDIIAQGKKIFLRCEPKTFTSSSNKSLATPAHLRTKNVDFIYYDSADDAASAGTGSVVKGGRVACLWETHMMTAYTNFWVAFEARYSAIRTQFWGIATMESALRSSAYAHPWSGYTYDKSMTAYKDMVTNMRSVLPDWPLISEMNNANVPYQTGLINNAVSNNAFFGGPDIGIYPNDLDRPGIFTFIGGPYKQNIGVMPIFHEMQDGAWILNQREWGIEPTRLLRFLTTPVNATGEFPNGGFPIQGLHITPNDWDVTSPYHFEDDMIPAIDAFEGFPVPLFT